MPSNGRNAPENLNCQAFPGDATSRRWNDETVFLVKFPTTTWVDAHLPCRTLEAFSGKSSRLTPRIVTSHPAPRIGE
jgi:hypothetical protein